MFSDDEKRAIRRLYLWPKLGTYFLFSLFPGLAVWIACIAVDDAILKSQGVYLFGLYSLLPFVFVYVALCLVFSIGTRVMANRPAWRSVERKVFGEAADTPLPGELYAGIGTSAAGRLMNSRDGGTPVGKALEVVGGALGFFGFWRLMRAFHEAARIAAEKGGVRLPSLGTWRAMVVLVPILVFVAVFTPRLVSSAQASSEARGEAAERVSAIEAAFEDGGCAYVSADDPTQRQTSYGYSVYGYLDALDEPLVSYACVDTDASGALKEISYHADIDVTLSPEENLASVRADFDRLASMLSGLGMPSPTLPPEFTEEFLAGTYYDDVSVYEGTEEGLTVYAHFSTDPEEEFDEDSDTYIFLSIEV